MRSTSDQSLALFRALLPDQGGIAQLTIRRPQTRANIALDRPSGSGHSLLALFEPLLPDQEQVTRPRSAGRPFKRQPIAQLPAARRDPKPPPARLRNAFRLPEGDACGSGNPFQHCHGRPG